MATVSATFLQAYRTRREIKLVVHNQYLLDGNLEKTHQGANCLPAAIHEGERFLQTELAAVKLATHNVTMKPRLGMKILPATTSELIHKPKPGVMPGWFVFGAGITQPHDKLNCRHRPDRSAFSFGGFFATLGWRFTFDGFFLTATTTNVNTDNCDVMAFATPQFNQTTTFRQRQIAEVNRITNIQTGYIDLNIFRQIIR